MRILPRSRWGRTLAIVGVVLIALDVMTLFGSLRLFTINAKLTNGVDASLAGGSFDVVTAYGLRRMGQGRWLPPQDRALWPSTSYYPMPRGGNFRRTRLPLWHLWFPATYLALFIERRDARRIRHSNACAACGYDLTGLALDARCPECGQPRA